MNALAFLLGSRALEIARTSAPAPARPPETLPPIASTPETAAAWRRWREADLQPLAAPDRDPRTARRLERNTG